MAQPYNCKMTSLIFQTIGVVGLLVLGFLFGRVAEKRHFKRLVEREANSQELPVVATRYPPEDRNYRQQLVTGNVVIASDYFKVFLAGLINIFGGRVTPYESMLDRARRESVLRMKDQEPSLMLPMSSILSSILPRLLLGALLPWKCLPMAQR